MPVMRYFEVTEVRTIKVRAETVPDAVMVAEAGFSGQDVDPDRGNITRPPIIIEMHAKECM